MHLIFFLALTFLLQAKANQEFLPLPLLTRNDHTLHLKKHNLRVVNTVAGLEHSFLGTIQWERSKENLLLPRIKIRLRNTTQLTKHFYFKYQKKLHQPQTQNNSEFVDLDITLLDADRVEVMEGDQKVGEVYVAAFGASQKETNLLMDYSCSGYNLRMYGFDGSFVTVGCELMRDNHEGELIPSLRVHWNSNGYQTLDGSKGPYLITFTEGREARLKVKNAEGEIKEVSIRVDFPQRLHRLKLAAGIGPYIYESSNRGARREDELLPSIMLYGNYYLNSVHSLKFFEALVMKESVFNHAGFYLGSELGKFYDDRLSISSLVGFQALSHKFNAAEEELYTQVIFPQGLELAFNHPFGLENYRFVLGGFLSPQPNVIYQNFWVRFGSRYFLEFNYINWEYQTREASMLGLSIGFPIAKFL
jgi:hypothetical protein